MIRLMTAAAAISALAMTPALSAAEVEIEAEGPVIELTISENVLTEPDFATIYAGVQTEAPTAVEAMRQNATEMRKVVEMIKALGIPEKDIQTASVSLGAQYDYNSETRRRDFRGYGASNRVTVKLSDTDDIGSTLDALVSSGANSISGPYFGLDNTEAPKAEAREKALERGKSRAEAYAKSLGYDGVEVLEISETIRGYSEFDGFESAVLARESVDASYSTPIEVGRVSTGVRLLIKYEAVNDESETEE